MPRGEELERPACTGRGTIVAKGQWEDSRRLVSVATVARKLEGQDVVSVRVRGWCWNRRISLSTMAADVASSLLQRLEGAGLVDLERVGSGGPRVYQSITLNSEFSPFGFSRSIAAWPGWR